MKNFLAVLLGIACLLVMLIGHFNWNEKIQSANATDETTHIQVSTNGTQDTENNTTTNNKVIALASNWPTQAINRLQQTQSDKTSFNILFVGSPTIGSESDGTFKIVKDKMIETFGEKNIDLTLKTFDLSSSQFIKNNYHEEIAAEAADLVVIEPFILMDNGLVEISDSLENLSILIEAIHAKNPETSIIIQPSNPLHNAKYYPIQVEAVKEYAAQNQLTYLDHWTAWPDQKSDEMIEYLLPEQSYPSDKGIQVWSEYLLNYFISNEDESN